jgi:hypothetical protein
MTYILQETGLAKRLFRNVPFTLKQDVDIQSGQVFFLFLIKVFLLEALIVAHLVNKFLAFHDTLPCAQVASLNPMILSQLIQSAHHILPVGQFLRHHSPVCACGFQVPCCSLHLSRFACTSDMHVRVLQIEPNSSSLI